MKKNLIKTVESINCEENKPMSYDDVVKMIKKSEDRVDEVLKAARLQRHEKTPMSKERFEVILNFIRDILFGVAITVGILAFFYLMTH